MKIEVTRAFCIAGEPQPVGKQMDVDDRFARELIYNGKAMPAAEKPAEPEKKTAAPRAAKEKSE